MPSVLPRTVEINMQEVTPILKRCIGIRRAMQALADWDRNRRGFTSESLRLLPRDDQASYKQTVERIISEFEQGAYDADPSDREAIQKAERNAFILMERQKARLAAATRGHDLSTWIGVDGGFTERADCKRCGRSASLVVTYDPLLDIKRQGSALEEGCIVAAEDVP